MATVLQFPGEPPRPPMPEGKAARARPLAVTHGRRGEYALADVARELKLSHFSVRSIIEKLRALAKHAAMPLPRTPRFVLGQPVLGPRAICRASRWDAGEIDAWIEGGPSGGAPAAPKPLPRPVADEMARRAEKLGQAA